MPQTKVYKKPEITRIKLNAGEAIMANCKSTTQRSDIVRKSTPCSMADVSCRNPIS